MNRAEFMRQLESLLQNISQSEREEALQYYNDYFDDAGPNNEQDVIDALGNPAKVAESIKRDILGSGYGDNVNQKAAASERAVVKYQYTTGAGNEQSKDGENKDLPTWAIVLIVILCILASPIIVSVGSGILGTLFGLIIAWFSLSLGFGVAAVALLAVLVVLLVIGVMCMFSSPLTGMALIGGGLVCGGLGFLFLMLMVAMAGIATPTICKGIVSLCKKLFEKKEMAI